MADKKLSELTSITSADIASGDLLLVSDVSAGISKSITYGELTTITTGDLNFADNAKAIFGAGSDLQIYHSGTDSYIVDSGVGDLRIQANQFKVMNAAGTLNGLTYDPATGVTALYNIGNEKLATTATGIDVTGDVAIGDGSSSSTRFLMGTGGDSKMFHNGVDTYWINDTGNIVIRNQSDDKDILLQTDDGLGGTTTYITVDGSETDVSLHYGGSAKLATTATGVDVTGTVTADGLVVESNGTAAVIRSTIAPYVKFEETSVQDAFLGMDSGNFWVRQGSLGYNSFNISSGNDISFYEDTGTTPKFFWDASAESLGIGTSSPSVAMHTVGKVRAQKSGQTSAYVQLSADELTSNYAADIFLSDTGLTFKHNSNLRGFVFDRNGTQVMTLDANGNLLVGATTTTNMSDGTGNDGVALNPAGTLVAARTSNVSMVLNRLSTDGPIANFNKDGSTVGSISTINGDLFIGTGNTALRFTDGAADIRPVNSSGTNLDATTDLGASATRFKDLYLSGGVYLGGTGAANKLDDYEEGTWTPAIHHVSGFDSSTFLSVDCRYTKIGRQVTLEFEFALSSSTGNVTAGDDIVLTSACLPFTPAFNGHAVGTVGVQANMETGEDTAIGYAGFSGFNKLGLVFHTVDGTVARLNVLGGVVTYFTT